MSKKSNTKTYTLPASRAAVIATMEKTIMDKMGQVDKAKRLFAKWWDVAEKNADAIMKQQRIYRIEEAARMEEKSEFARSPEGFEERADRVKALKLSLHRNHPDTCADHDLHRFKSDTAELKQLRQTDLRIREKQV